MTGTGFFILIKSKASLAAALNEKAARIAEQVGNDQILSKTKILKQKIERA